MEYYQLKAKAELAERMFERGAQSRQAEINELNKVIDEALKHVVDHGGYDDLTHVINILKGNKND